MKSIRTNPLRRLEDELYMSNELEELLYQQWLLQLKKEEQENARVHQIRLKMYFWGGVCLSHDRTHCPECSSYARGECPSSKEEGW